MRLSGLADLVDGDRADRPRHHPNPGRPEVARLPELRLNMTRSLRHRLYRRHEAPHVWWQVPIVSSYIDRLRDAAMAGQVCQPFVVSVKEGR